MNQHLMGINFTLIFSLSCSRSHSSMTVLWLKATVSPVCLLFIELFKIQRENTPKFLCNAYIILESFLEYNSNKGEKMAFQQWHQTENNKKAEHSTVNISHKILYGCTMYILCVTIDIKLF